jgi:endoglucanase
MLAAEIAKQPATVRVVWAWTSQHLRRPDGLLAFHASGDGTILDPQPAPDADILIAYALLRYGGPDARALHNGGTRLASSVMRLESVTAPGGAPVIAAGLWAMGAPVTIDPSYWMPPVFRALATLTGDQRWSHSADASVTLVDRATTGGRLLPADWAHLDGSRLDPIPAPSGGAAARYGLDAARLPVWFAVDCSAPARRLAASWWNDVLSVDDRTTPIALSLKGQVMDPSTNPLPLVAGAAAAEAAGDGSRVAQLRANAVSQAERTPTYYGDAWLALGEALLDRTLTVC